MRAFTADILRTVWGTRRRFASIAAITLLGVAMLVGLRIACADLRMSADGFFDSQRLFDVRVQSTLGLTQDDVDALGALDGVGSAEGAWGETAYAQVGGGRSTVSVATFAEGGANEPYLLEGRLPKAGNEVAVTPEFLRDAGKAVGDTVTFAADADALGEAAGGAAAEGAATGVDGGKADEGPASGGGDAEVFRRQEYVIVGTALDPTSVSAKNGSSSFRSTGPRYSFFVTKDAVEDQGVYTVVYLRLPDGESRDAFSKGYKARVEEVTRRAEAIKAERERARGEQVRAEASAKVDDAQAETESQLEDAQRRLDDAQAQIDEALAQVAAGRERLAAEGADATAQLDAAQRRLDAGRAQLEAASAQLDDGEAELNARTPQLDEAGAKVERGRAQVEDAQARIDAARQAEARIAAGAGQLAQAMGDGWPAEQWQAVCDATDPDASAAAQDALVGSVRAWAGGNEEALAAAVTRANETDALLGRLISGEDGLRDEVIGRTAELAAMLAGRFPDYARQVTEVHDLVVGFDGDTGTLEQARSKLAQVTAGLATQLAQLQALPGQAAQLASGMGQLAQGRAELERAERELPAQRSRLDEAERQVADGRAQLQAAREHLEGGRAQTSRELARLEQGQRELDAQRAQAQARLDDAARQLDDGELQAQGGQAELDESRAEFGRQKAEALDKIADVRRQVDEIDDATWYVQDRTSLSSFSSIETDASSIEAIATVFPAIFLVVAVLVSLTTATRMVEEQRGLIGLYKALGYGRGRIMGKYVSYTLGASLTGGALGALVGFLALPEFLFSVFRVMYSLPSYDLHFDAALCALAIGLFAVGIGVATALTCASELNRQPAELMRPKAPRAGTRILLERLRPVWSRMSFLNKVTARNLFRHKKRLVMTVFGIAGCTALLICGFAIRDTVLALTPNQYGDASHPGVDHYDLLVVTQPRDIEAAAGRLAEDGEVSGCVAVAYESVTLEHDGAKETVQLMVVPDGFSLDGYVELRDEDGTALDLAKATAGADGVPGTADDGVLATKNAAMMLGFGTGDAVDVQDSRLRQATATVDGVVMSYIGNTVYMTQSTYERLFGVRLEANALLAHLVGDADEQISYAEGLRGDARLLAVTSVKEQERDFTQNFMLINYVVALVTVLAAGLALVVLFTLSTTNISERERELATIKVLGFRRGEVRTYINKETVVLTLIGIACGIPVGTALGHALTWALAIPSMYFAVEISPASYVWSCALSLAFALVVSLVTNRALDRVDMVGALKSAE